MKNFALAGLLSIATAEYSIDYYRNLKYGTTGHYGNQFGHGGFEDHDHNDHMYGYDSVKSKRSLKDPASAGYTRNSAMLTSLKTVIDSANTDRVTALQRVKARRAQRMTEIDTNNRRKVSAPFEY